ncbi:MAG: tetratricopeptide repeat protein, partial [Acidobacteria bacterium]|nr:tetratricopeptide repeat protein [Acidobacteriota bacterium]
MGFHSGEGSRDFQGADVPVRRNERYRIEPNPFNKQKPDLRVHNWNETFLGFTQEVAIDEASRCLECEHAPCMYACPVRNDIPEAMFLIAGGRFAEGAQKFFETSNMPDVCGRICPQESLCEGACVLTTGGTPVRIGKLEAFCTDYLRSTDGFLVQLTVPPSGYQVAVIGAGPAGLAVAEELARRGFGTPVLLRFPQLLAGQVASLSTAFDRAMEEFDYPGGFHPVFPIKVNQNRPVVEALLQSGWSHSLGLEVGSCPEMLAATSLALPPDALTICNGYKDANYLDALNGLAISLVEVGRTQEALAYVERTIRLNPTDPRIYLNFAMIYLRYGYQDEAARALRHGLNHKPDDLHLSSRLAWLLATSSKMSVRDGNEALTLARTVCEKTNYRVPATLDILAAAYAETGQFKPATEMARRAHQLAVMSKREDLATKI